MARFTHIWKTGVVVTALLATVVACGNSDTSRARNTALVAGTKCVKPGAVSKISKVTAVCAKTKTGNIWYPTTKSYGRSVACIKSGAVRKKKSVVWVCGVVKSKKLWLATSPLPPVVLQATAVVIPGVVEPVPVLESTDVATPSRPVVADNNVLANPTITDESPVTTPVTIATVPETITTVAPIFYKMGERGPGGGIVFYVADKPFTCGEDLTAECTYLEAAPNGWHNSNSDPNLAWGGGAFATGSCKDKSIAGAQIPSIGSGAANTAAIMTACPDVTGDNSAPAALAASSYAPNGKAAGWFLPSKDELNALCKWAFDDTVNTICNNNGAGGLSLKNDGFAGTNGGPTGYGYWSSSESATDNAWRQRFRDGSQVPGGRKSGAYYVRPVRAF